MATVTLMDSTQDQICRGFLRIHQPARGYRFNLDSILLAAFSCGQAAPGVVVDAGAGCGVVGLYVAKVTGQRTVLLERQAAMVALAARNAQDNQLPQAHAVHGDFCSVPLQDGCVGLLVSNPPFLTPGTGRPSPNPQRTLSHQAIHGGGQDVLTQATRLLSPQGALVCLLPPEQSAALFADGLYLRRVWTLSPREGQAATRVVTVWRREPGAVVRETRTIHGADGRFCPWVDDVLEGRVHGVG